eukprot:CAMPEP_0197195562 /NCGR_PEP_ID=MMETSP1423-20130617/31367_1 /TAXON_ID=476441 /ORGANISM="Pseudo-nitzschia heimii, Strain UNC1101" /LENGTH=975 /DNA_ID=CAMNT_0042649221 /DNA_START=449 /DNA_END=3376 /DNA_ORIENTATION=-
MDAKLHYWRSVCVLVSCFSFGAVVLDLICAEYNASTPYGCLVISTFVYYGNALVVMIVFITRHWSKSISLDTYNGLNDNERMIASNNINISNGNDVERGNHNCIMQGNKIHANDLCFYLLFSAMGYATIILIDRYSLGASLSILIIISVVVVGAWCEFESPPSNPSSSKKNEGNYPRDTYSFLAFYDWKTDNDIVCFALLIFLLQVFFLATMISCSVIPSWKNKVTDNVHEGSMGMFAANAKTIVSITQVTSLVAFILFPYECIEDLIVAIEFFPRRRLQRNADKSYLLAFSCILRFTQAVLGIITIFLMVMTSTNVIGIILNYLSVNHISKLDNYAFEFAEQGYYGQNIENATAKINAAKLLGVPAMDEQQKFHRSPKGLAAVRAIAILVLITSLGIVIFRERPEVWKTEIVRVEFKDQYFKDYNGCYRIDQNKMFDKRYLYNSFDGNRASAKFGYCKAEHKWILFTGDDITPCKAFGQDNEIAHSSVSYFYDIGSSTRVPWFSTENYITGKRFFFERDVENLEESCGSFLDDEEGKCVEIFNNRFHDYDGGNCCPFTCKGTRCGEVEGSIAEVLYPNCVREDFSPIKIQIDRKNTKTIENYLFELRCEDKTIFKSYMNQSEQIAMLPTNGTSCTFFSENLLDDQANTNIPYKIFYEAKDYNNDDLNDLNSYLFNHPMHQGSVPAKSQEEKFGLFLNGGFSGNISEISSHIELLTKLDVTSLTGDKLSGQFPKEMAHMSQFESFTLHHDGFDGTIPSEVGLMTNLELLSFQNGQLNGSIPSDIALLTNLKTLSFSGNQFTGSIPFEIDSLTKLKMIRLSNNGLTGSIPGSIGRLTDLEMLLLYNNELTGSIPSEIGLLKNLQYIALAENKFTGTIPSNIGYAEKLQSVYLAFNQITGNLPSEIGRLTNLGTLDFSHNHITGSIPTEIGLPKNLQHINLCDNNLTSYIPTEIDVLQSLFECQIDNNELSVEGPGQ